jgi:hypothetical protein
MDVSQSSAPTLFADLPKVRLAGNDTTLTSLVLLNRLGRFDLDPCGFPGHPTARQLICLPDDGLQRDWHGRVWLNPPYSNPMPWLERLLVHGNGIALVLASTDTKWFHDYVPKAAAVLFLHGRPTFFREDLTEVGLMRASVLVAYGDDNASCLARSGIGGWFVQMESAK